MLDLDLIRIDGGTQSRAALNQETVNEYAEAYKAGIEFPPVVVFFDGKDRWLADGFHRYFGAKTAGLKSILEKIIPGTNQHAFEYSLGANHSHGLKRTNADKRHAVELALKNAVLGKQSDNAIAQACAVSQPFVSDVRKSIFKRIEDRPAQKIVTRNGTTYEQDTSNIGKTASKDVAPTPPPPAETAEMEEDFGPDAEEIASMEAAQAADVAAMGKLFEADDKLGAAFAEIKRLNAEVAQLRLSRDGYMNKSNELISTVKSLQRKLERAQKVAA
jgi:hypothetical protein